MSFSICELSGCKLHMHAEDSKENYTTVYIVYKPDEDLFVDIEADDPEVMFLPKEDGHYQIIRLQIPNLDYYIEKINKVLVRGDEPDDTYLLAYKDNNLYQIFYEDQVITGMEVLSSLTDVS